MQERNIFIKFQRDGTISLQNNRLDRTYLMLDNVNEATNFAVRLLKSIGYTEALNDPS